MLYLCPKIDLVCVHRPRLEEEFEKIPGIRESFGFMAFAVGCVEQREFDCWCNASIDAPHTISCAQERRVLASLTGA